MPIYIVEKFPRPEGSQQAGKCMIRPSEQQTTCPLNIISKGILEHGFQMVLQELLLP